MIFPLSISLSQYKNIIIMNPHLQFYKNLRIYSHLSFYQIINQIVCNRLMTSKSLVAASPYLYKAACRFPGKIITNWFIGSTFNRIFTGGNQLQDIAKSTYHLKERGIPIIIDFCAEGAREQLDCQSILDENAVQFRRSAEVAAKIPNQLMSIKISALINLDLLQKYNRAVNLRDKIWNNYNVDGKINAQSLFDAIHKIYSGLTTQDISSYLKNIHGFNQDIEQFQIDEIGFKMNHQPFYIYQPHKNEELVQKILFPLDNRQKREINNMIRRLDQILNKQFHNPNNLRVLVDAEQSFIQRAIENITQQIQAHYNQQRPYIINTLQNYLKIAQKRADFQLEITKRRNLHLGIKLVRGAYLVQETKISKQNDTQFPIVNHFDATTVNYLRNFQILTSQQIKGTVFAATHNENTLKQLLSIKSKASPTIQINFAQLFGLADHLTFMLKDQRVSVYKLLPWAQTHVMVGYLIRRGQELSQTNYPLQIQYALLKNELYVRTVSL